MNKNLLVVFGYCTLLSALFLSICTKSSPLYPFNDWVDANAFFTMGKSMMNGKVIYKDLFEQKGPLLYLIHGIGYLLSNRSFFGVFIIEIVSFSIFLFYNYKIFHFYLKPIFTYIGLAILAFVVLNVTNFTHGDSAEELCLPVLAISLFYLIDYFKNTYPAKIKLKYILLNGVLAGCILCIKYSLLGFWFGWMAVIFFSLVIQKEFLFAIKSCFVFLGGMIIAIIPWLIYFYYHNGIQDFIDAYFLINIKYYSADGTLLERLLLSAYYCKNYLIDNGIFAVLTLLGIINLIFSKQIISNWIGKLAILASFGFLILGVYGGGVIIIYYFVIITPIVFFGILSMLILIQNYYEKYGFKLGGYYLLSILVIFLVIVTYKTNHNTYFLNKNQHDLFQYTFAEIINQNDNPTLLNYGVLDVGLYTTTGIIPTVKHFEKQNILYEKYPVNIDEQNNYIKGQVTDFVVVRKDDFYEKYSQLLNQKYTLIKEQDQYFEGHDYTYLLFKANRIKN